MYEEHIIEENEQSVPLLEEPKERLGFLDYLLGLYIIVVMIFEYTDYRYILSNLGMLIPVLFLCGMMLNWFTFQKEFFSLTLLAVWLIMGCLTSDYPEMSFLSIKYYLKVQFLMMFVALQCSSFKRMRFYIWSIALGTAFLVIPSILFRTNLRYTQREIGTVGEPNALAAIAAISFIAWLCLFFMMKSRLKWLLCPVMAVASFGVILLSASRGGVVTVIFFVFFGSLFALKRSSMLLKVCYVLFLVTGCGIAFFIAKDMPFMQRLTQETGHGETAMQALSVFKQNPIMGAGWGTFIMYTPLVNTHTTPLDFLYGSGIMGVSLYYFVIISGWFVLARSKKIYQHDRQVWVYATLCQLLLLAQMGAGLSLPAHTQKAQAVLSGIWLGVVWYLRTAHQQQVALEQEYKAQLQAGTENPEAV
jgi:hypothetical protein